MVQAARGRAGEEEGVMNRRQVLWLVAIAGVAFWLWKSGKISKVDAPGSKVKENLAETCRSCHPGSSSPDSVAMSAGSAR